MLINFSFAHALSTRSHRARGAGSGASVLSRLRTYGRSVGFSGSATAHRQPQRVGRSDTASRRLTQKVGRSVGHGESAADPESGSVGRTRRVGIGPSENVGSVGRVRIDRFEIRTAQTSYVKYVIVAGG